MASSSQTAHPPAPTYPTGLIAAARAASRRHPITAYLLVTYAASWSYWLWMGVAGWISTPGGSETHFPGLLGPAIGAVVVSWLIRGRAGLAELAASIVRWRLPLRWYGVAALPFGFFLAGAAIETATGGAAPTLDRLALFSGLPALGLPLVMVLALLINCFGEEIGWRGFATPTLLERHGFIVTSLLVGAMWALWHIPSIPVIHNYREMGWAIVPMFLFGLGSGAFVFTWLWIRTQSVLIAALFHLALNLGSATDAARGLAGAAATTGIMLWAVGLIVLDLRRPGEVKPSNRPLASLLRSPLGRWLGRSVALVTFSGRRSGRTLSTPVEYVRDGAAALVFVASPDRKQWWRNVRAEPTVRVVLAGQALPMRATVLDDGGPAAVQALTTYLAARPRLAKHLGLAGSPPYDGAALEAAARGSVLVRFEPVAG